METQTPNTTNNTTPVPGLRDLGDAYAPYDGPEPTSEVERRAVALQREKAQREQDQREQQQAGPQQEQNPQEKSDGLAYKDPWDEGAVQQDADPFAVHRRAAAHQLEVPSSATVFGAEGWDQSVQDDYAIASRASGFSQPLAQALLDEAANGARGGKELDFRMPDGSYNTDMVRSALRFEWEGAFEENLTRISRFVNSKPALRDFLNSSGLGDSPAVLRVLNGIAHDPSILNPAKAQQLIAKVKNDPKHPYWLGSKTAVAHMRAAHIVVEAARRKK